MKLLQVGVPYEVALKMSAVKRAALIVAAGEIRGGEFDWEAKRWTTVPQQ